MISVTAHIESVTSALSELQRDVVPRATQQALNRAADTVRSRTTKEIARVMALRRQGLLKGIIVLHKASKNSLSATVTTSDKNLGLEDTKNTVVRVYRKGKRRISKVVFKGQTLDGAFRIEQIGNLSRGIFKAGEGKYGSGNRKVKRLFAYPVLQELIHGQIDKIQEQVGTERFEVEFDRALANELRRLRLA